MRPARHVAVFVDHRSPAGAGVLLGIADHVSRSERWAVEWVAPGKRVAATRGQGWDGLIATAGFPPDVRPLARLGIPLVVVGGNTTDPDPVQFVALDVPRLARLAAERFLACGCASYAVLGAEEMSGPIDAKDAVDAKAPSSSNRSASTRNNSVLGSLLDHRGRDTVAVLGHVTHV